MKKSEGKWFKIIVTTRDGCNSREPVASMVAAFERDFKVAHLYYARYTNIGPNGVKSTFELSALTRAEPRTIKRFFRHFPVVIGVKIVDRGTGSLAHAYAYQAVKNITVFDEDRVDDNDFLDVIHWMCNMRGLDYLREGRIYAFAAMRILHQQALDSQRSIQIMTAFNEKMRRYGAALLDETIYEKALIQSRGKGRGLARDSAGGPQSKRPRSSRAGARTERGSSRSRSSGSGRR